MNIKRFAVPVIPALVAAIALGALPQRLKHPYASDPLIAEPAIFGDGVIAGRRRRAQSDGIRLEQRTRRLAGAELPHLELIADHHQR